jgi:hypothetical protein
MNDDYEITEVKGTDPFTMIPNSTRDDENLSNKALGLLSRMIGRPPGWILRRKFFITTKDGKAAIKSQLEELQDAGYLILENQKQNGRFLPMKILVRKCLSIPWEGPTGTENRPRSIPTGTENRLRTGTENRSISNKHKKKHCAVAGTGVSLGVEETSFEAILTDRFYKLAIENRWLTPRQKPPLKKWRTAVGQLVADNNHETDIIKKVFDWYLENHKWPWAPKVRALTTFCGYFQRMADARRRWLEENPEERGGHWVDDTRQCVKNGKVIIKKYRRWEIDED